MVISIEEKLLIRARNNIYKAREKMLEDDLPSSCTYKLRESIDLIDLVIDSIREETTKKEV